MLSADAVEKANSGHPGAPMGDADMAFILWTKFLKHNPSNPKWPNRDRFVLSAGHASILLYTLLYLTGYDISLSDIKNFRQMGSKTPGHPEYDLDHGVELSTGPLGFGFAVGVGMAMAEKFLADYFNRPGFNVVDYNIYGIVSDGDVMEGVASEAASLAGHLGLGKLIYLYSDNQTTIDGNTNLTFSEDVGKRFEAYNWHVEHVDGYHLIKIEDAINAAKREKNRPSLIIAKTHLGYGSPTKQDMADIHGAPLGEEELRRTKENLGWPQKNFYVPKDVLKFYRQAQGVGKKEEEKWNALFKKYRAKHPEPAAQWDIFSSGFPVGDWKKHKPFFPVESKSVATRSASSNVLNSVAEAIPNLLGGSADLSPSNMTFLKKYGRFTREKADRNIHYGVREFAMAAATCGLALSKMLIPYCGTYLVFSGYMLPAVRMAAMMKLRAIFILTHDSIGVGEDGPSHHPIEQLVILRSVPGLTVIRPADANETVAAYELAFENPEGGPVIMALTRQRVPVIDRSKYASHEGLKQGAYVLADAKPGKQPEIILIATGSEVHIALEAYEKLKAEGAAIRLVSMPSFELFDAQPQDYRDSVLPPEVEKRLAVEAGSTLCWYKYVGLKGAVIGIDQFGISAPAEELFKHFGFTAENVIKTVREMMKG
jgi:transketolase